MENTLQTLQGNLHRLVNFLQFAKAYFIRKNPFKAFAASIVASIKDMLSIKQKLKLSKYRVNYHQYQLKKMEQLIAENNEHTFLRGNKVNETR